MRQRIKLVGGGFALAVVLTGCIGQGPSLVGKWTEEPDSRAQCTIEFRADSTCTLVQKVNPMTFTFEGTYHREGDILTIHQTDVRVEGATTEEKRLRYEVDFKKDNGKIWDTLDTRFMEDGRLVMAAKRRDWGTVLHRAK